MSQVATTGLVSQPRLRWRQELLRVAYAGMEISWFTQFFLFLIPPARLHPPYATAAVLGLVLMGVYAWTSLAEARQWSATLERSALLLALPVLVLLGWRIYLHPELPPGDVSWLGVAGTAVLTAGSAAYWTIMAAVMFLWWRGLALGRREYTFETVAYAFRSGLLLLVIGTLLLSYVTRDQILIFIAPFFFFGLLAVALARLEEVGQIKGDVGRTFDLMWLGILVLVAALTVGLASGLLAWLARPAGLETLRALWSPLGEWLLTALMWLLSILLAPLEPLLRWLSGLLADAWLVILESPVLDGIGAVQPIVEEDTASPQVTRLFELVFTGLRLLCGAGVLGALLLAGLYWLNQTRKQQPEQEEAHERIDASPGNALSGLLDRLRGAVRLFGQFGVGGDLLAAISVRALYANMARLARQRGYPRHKARTPYEYLPDLRAAFPAAQGEAQAITDAYVAVHYGEAPTSGEEMDALRAAYNRLKDSALPPR